MRPPFPPALRRARTARVGYHVYAGVRTHAGGVALHQHTPPDAGLITPLLLDVTRPIQVNAAVRAVTAHTGPGGLAGLVTDAGTDGFGPRPAVSVTGELAVIRGTSTSRSPSPRRPPEQSPVP